MERRDQGDGPAATASGWSPAEGDAGDARDEGREEEADGSDVGLVDMDVVADQSAIDEPSATCKCEQPPLFAQ